MLEAIAAINARATGAEHAVGILSLAPAPDRLAAAEREIVAGFAMPEGQPDDENPSTSDAAMRDSFDTAFKAGDDRPAPPEDGDDDEPEFSSEDD